MKKALILFTILGLLVPHIGHARFLESPAPNAIVSGIGFISGWKCGAENISVRIDIGPLIELSEGVERSDTAGHCNGQTMNGFITQVNWNLLKAGEHRIAAFENGQGFASQTFTVGTTGEEFLRDTVADIDVEDFPRPGKTSRFVWNQSTQHLELVGVYGQDDADVLDFGEVDLHAFQFLVDRKYWTIRVPGIRVWERVSYQNDADIHFDRIGATSGGFETVTGHLQGTRLKAGVLKPGLPIPFQIGRPIQILPQLPSLYDDTYALVIPVQTTFQDGRGNLRPGEQCYIVVFNLIKRGPNGGLDTLAYFTISRRENGECVPNGREEFMTGLLSTRLVIE